MITGVLLAFAAALVYAFLGVSYEVAAKRKYKIWDVVLYMQLAGLLIGLTVSAYSGRLVYSPRLLGLGLAGALTFVAGLSCYLMASRERDIAANWTVVNLSVALPILVSVFWFKDAFTLVKALGVVLTLLSIVVIGGGLRGMGEAGNSSRWYLYIGLAFLLNAWIPILLRFVPSGQSSLFTTYLYGIGFLLLLVVRLARNRQWSRDRGLLSISLTAAVTHWSGVMLTMAALSAVARVSSQAGVIVYPITNGLVIPLAVMLGALLLKQKVSKRGGMGVALGVVAMVLLSLP